MRATPDFDFQLGEAAEMIRESTARFADEHGVKHSLKPVCAAHGVDMVELDRTRLHEYTPAERAAYALSDSRGTRALTLRLLGLDYAPYAA